MFVCLRVCLFVEFLTLRDANCMVLCCVADSGVVGAITVVCICAGTALLKGTTLETMGRKCVLSSVSQLSAMLFLFLPNTLRYITN